MDGEALEPEACHEHSSAFVMASPLASGFCSQTSPCLVTLWPPVPPEHTVSSPHSLHPAQEGCAVGSEATMAVGGSGDHTG